MQFTVNTVVGLTVALPHRSDCIISLITASALMMFGKGRIVHERNFKWRSGLLVPFLKICPLNHGIQRLCEVYAFSAHLIIDSCLAKTYG